MTLFAALDIATGEVIHQCLPVIGTRSSSGSCAPSRDNATRNSSCRLIEPPLRVMRWALLRTPVEDGVPEGGVADDVVPVLGGELGGDDASVACVAVVEDFEQVVAAPDLTGSESPVVEDDEPSLGESLDELGI